MIGWIPRLLLRLVVRTQTPRSPVWFGGEDTYSILLGEEIDTFLPGSGLFVSVSHLTGLDTKSMTRRSVYSEEKEVGARAGLCWSWVHLV